MLENYKERRRERKEERKKKLEERKRAWEEKRKMWMEIDEKLQKVEVFIGDKEEFEKFAGYKTEFIKLDSPLKHVRYEPMYNDTSMKWINEYTSMRYSNNPLCRERPELQKKLAEEGIVAVVDAKPKDAKIHYASWVVKYSQYVGIPVKKAKLEELCE